MVHYHQQNTSEKSKQSTTVIYSSLCKYYRYNGNELLKVISINGIKSGILGVFIDCILTKYAFVQDAFLVVKSKTSLDYLFRVSSWETNLVNYLLESI